MANHLPLLTQNGPNRDTPDEGFYLNPRPGVPELDLESVGSTSLLLVNESVLTDAALLPDAALCRTWAFLLSRHCNMLVPQPPAHHTDLWLALQPWLPHGEHRGPRLALPAAQESRHGTRQCRAGLAQAWLPGLSLGLRSPPPRESQPALKSCT